MPLTNASITDCVFEVARDTTAEEVNALLEEASKTYLAGILGYETAPLVSTDYVNDPRSGVVDAPCTMVRAGGGRAGRGEEAAWEGLRGGTIWAARPASAWPRLRLLPMALALPPGPQVIDKRMVKIYAWYDNEWGYSQRTVDIARMVAAKMAA